MANARFPSRPLAAVFASVVASSLLSSSLPARAQAAIDLPEAQVQALLAECADGESCAAATADLITTLAEDNPAVPVAEVVSTVAAQLIEAYNQGVLPAELVVTLLTAVSEVAATNGLTDLSSTLNGAVELALAGEAIDAAIVIGASASPT